MDIKSDFISDNVLNNIAYLKSELIFMSVQTLDCDSFCKKKVLKKILDLLDSFSSI